MRELSDIHSTARQLRAAVIPEGNNRGIEGYLLHLVQIRPSPRNSQELELYDEIGAWYNEVRRLNSHIL